MADEQQTQNNSDQSGRQLVPSRIPYPKAAGALFDIESHQWRILAEAIYPGAQTPESIMLALAYCKSRNLDIFKKPCHIVGIWNSQLRRTVESVWPGIAELRTTAMRTGVYGGCDETEFGPNVTTTFTGRIAKGTGEKRTYQTLEKTITYPEWIRITVYRFVQNQRVAFPGPKTYFRELFAGVQDSGVPNDRWERAPSSMLEKCAEAAALRKAFPEELGSDAIEEEAHVYAGGETIEGEFAAPAAAGPMPTRETVAGQTVQAKALEKAEQKLSGETPQVHIGPGPTRGSVTDTAIRAETETIDRETGEVKRGFIDDTADVLAADAAVKKAITEAIADGEILGGETRNADIAEQERELDDQFRAAVGPDQRQQTAGSDDSSHRTSDTPAAAVPPKVDGAPAASSNPSADMLKDNGPDKTTDLDKASRIVAHLYDCKSVEELEKVLAMHADVIPTFSKFAQDHVAAEAQAQRTKLAGEQK